MQFTGETTIEEIVNKVPEAVLYLSQQGIRCVVCGEPIWGTLAEAVTEKGLDQNELDRLLQEINRMSRY